MTDNWGVTPPHLQNLGNLPQPENTIDSEVDRELDVILVCHKVREINLVEAKTKLYNLIAQEANKAALNELEDFNKVIVLGFDRVEHYLRRKEALTPDKEQA